MENAAEALMMGFAVLVFVIALTVGITVFSQVRNVSDVMLYAQDETNYYDYQGAVGKTSQNRIVGLETIVPTLYKYYRENYTILFRQGSYDENTGEFSNLRPLTIYNVPDEKNANLWSEKYTELMEKKYKPYMKLDWKYTTWNKKAIFSFDLEEETLRFEPWVGSFDKAKENIDCFLYGEVYNNPNNEQEYIKYSGFIADYEDSKFMETVGEYTYSSSQASDTEDGSSISSLAKQKKKRIIIFTLIK